MADGRKRCPLCGIDYREVDGEQCCLVAFLRGKRRITGLDQVRQKKSLPNRTSKGCWEMVTQEY